MTVSVMCELFCGSFLLFRLSPLNLCGKCCYVDKKEELAEEKEARHFLFMVVTQHKIGN